MDLEDNKTTLATLDDIRNLPLSQSMEIMPRILLIKGNKSVYRYANMYVLLNEDAKEAFLIDAIREEAKEPVLSIMEQGYTVRGIILTHNHLIGQAFASVDTVSKTYGDAPLFMHPADISPYLSMIGSVIEEDNALRDFGLEVIHMDGHTYGSISIYSGIHGGTLFCGDSAIGSPYHIDDYYFERPPASSRGQDRKLAKVWKSIHQNFQNLLPLHGKPELQISPTRQEEILANLAKDEETLSL